MGNEPVENSLFVLHSGVRCVEKVPMRTDVVRDNNVQNNCLSRVVTRRSKRFEKAVHNSMLPTAGRIPTADESVFRR